ncbi:MAG: CARDB domain-containing protein, partial [candidate division KSB1 bacterium]|nr:CARDB domain-containing protein [candidate division KSB1 bacterium]
MKIKFMFLTIFMCAFNLQTESCWSTELSTNAGTAQSDNIFEWVDITNNLTHGTPSSRINDIAPHSFFGDSVWIGTGGGAYFSSTGGERWRVIELGNQEELDATVTETIPKPLVDCLCSVVGIGTSEPLTGSAEWHGRVFRSLLDGHRWENMAAPRYTVTALAFNYWNPFVIYAGLFNENAQGGGLYRFKSGTGWEQLTFVEDASLGNPKINCIAVDLADTNRIYIGTARGLYFTHNNAANWAHVLQPFNVVSILTPRTADRQEIYAATGGRSRSDGIYMSRSFGKEWDVIHWRTDIIELVDVTHYHATPPYPEPFYMAVYGQGVFVSLDNCHTWTGLNETLKDMNVTALASIPGKPGQLYLGAERGIYRYAPVDVTVDLDINDDDLAYWPPTPRDGELIEIYATVRNESSVDVFDIDVSFVDNADGMLTVIVPIDTLTIPHIPPYSEYTLRAEWYPDGQHGGNIIFVNVDPENRIREMNEENNMARIVIDLERPPYTRLWQNIRRNLPVMRVNDISGHPFRNGSLFIATDSGAYQSHIDDRQWESVKFTDPSDFRVSNIEAEMHPFLDWTEPVIWIGTEEYSDIPEDRLGRVFRSEDGGYSWRDLQFTNVAVSALHALRTNSLLGYAAAYNPFYYQDDFYFYQEGRWESHDLTPGNSLVNRINCFGIDHPDDRTLYIGTKNGLYIYDRMNNTMIRTLDHLNVVSIVTQGNYRQGALYAATSGDYFCDGVYLSDDGGMHWRKIANYKNIIALTEAAPSDLPGTAAPHLYLAVYDHGILESRNGGEFWKDITNNLEDLKIVSMAVDAQDPEAVYVGTENGIYWFDDPPST